MVDSSSEISSAHLDPVVSAVEELGKAILPYPGSVRIHWENAEGMKNMVLVFPRMAIDQNHRGYFLEPHLRETLCEGRVKARYGVA